MDWLFTIKTPSKTDAKLLDIQGSFEAVKEITNIKFKATKIIEENQDFYITDTYALKTKY